MDQAVKAAPLEVVFRMVVIAVNLHLNRHHMRAKVPPKAVRLLRNIDSATYSGGAR